MQGQSEYFGQKQFDMFRGKNNIFGGGSKDESKKQKQEQNKADQQTQEQQLSIGGDQQQEQEIEQETWTAKQIREEARYNHTFVFDVKEIKGNYYCESEKVHKLCCNEEKYNFNVNFYQKFEKDDKLKALKEKCDIFKTYCKCKFQ